MVRREEPITYFNRYNNCFEQELVFGERWLRWAYGNPLGRMTLPLFCARPWFSKFYGWWMSRPSSRSRIGSFVADYGVDSEEWLEPEGGFSSFNDFFMRRLKPAARPVDPDPGAICFPADGRHLGFASVEGATGVFVKGQRWDLEGLIGNSGLAEEFCGGSLVLSRLCPVDYHHFHFPLEGVPGDPHAIGRALYSVSPIALRRKLGYLWSNYRQVTRVEHPVIGAYLQIEVGATNVGSIRQCFKPRRAAKKGEHKGCFAFGGSSVITVFRPGTVDLAGDLLQHTRNFTELYARMGDRMGTLK